MRSAGSIMSVALRKLPGRSHPSHLTACQATPRSRAHLPALSGRPCRACDSATGRIRNCRRWGARGGRSQEDEALTCQNNGGKSETQLLVDGYSWPVSVSRNARRLELATLYLGNRTFEPDRRTSSNKLRYIAPLVTICRIQNPQQQQRSTL